MILFGSKYIQRCIVCGRRNRASGGTSATDYHHGLRIIVMPRTIYFIKERTEHNVGHPASSARLLPSPQNPRSCKPKMRILLNKPATRTWTWLRQLSTSLPASAFEQKGPLAGIKVLDLTRVLAGPFATQMLADNGADVIKIEIPKIGDDTRHWKDQAEQEFWKDDTQTSLYFASCNRGKRSIAVNLKQKEGVEIIKRLAKVCDVVYVYPSLANAHI